jgi:hypothetical protein
MGRASVSFLECAGLCACNTEQGGMLMEGSRRVVHNRHFDGLSYEAAGALRNYFHCRAPETPVAAAALTRKGVHQRKRSACQLHVPSICLWCYMMLQRKRASSLTHISDFHLIALRVVAVCQ